jgi:hypothetical protein
VNLCSLNNVYSTVLVTWYELRGSTRKDVVMSYFIALSEIL